jgi:hypothetical protein
MATSSIFNKFTIDSDEKMDILLEEKNNNKETREIPKIDINEQIKKGRKVLETF